MAYTFRHHTVYNQYTYTIHVWPQSVYTSILECLSRPFPVPENIYFSRQEIIDLFPPCFKTVFRYFIKAEVFFVGPICDLRFFFYVSHVLKTKSLAKLKIALFYSRNWYRWTILISIVRTFKKKKRPPNPFKMAQINSQ